MRKTLRNHLDLCARLVVDLLIERYKRDVMQFSELQDSRHYSLAHGLLNFVSPEWVAVGRRAAGLSGLFLEPQGTAQWTKTMTGQTTADAAHRLLGMPWSAYQRAGRTTKEIASVRNAKTGISLDGSGRFLCIAQSDDNDGIVLRFSDQSETSQLLSSGTVFSQLVVRLSDWHRYLLLDGSPHQWYRKAFGRPYELVDRERQRSAAFNDRQLNETTFVLQRLRSLGRGTTPVIVDLGVGYGRLAENLLRDCPEAMIVGVDISQSLLDRIRDRIRAKPELAPRIKLIECDFRQLDRLRCQNSADLVLSMFTSFGYFENDEEDFSTLKLAYGLLRPGGMLIVEQFNPKGGKWLASFDVKLRSGTIGVHKTSLLERKPDHSRYFWLLPLP